MLHTIFLVLIVSFCVPTVSLALYVATKEFLLIPEVFSIIAPVTVLAVTGQIIGGTLLFLIFATMAYIPFITVPRIKRGEENY
jgi:hypothetical protein